jgi:acetolactate synthase-1/2/3 large subunit
MGAGAPGERALSMIDLDRPRIDWQAMATSMGVPSVAVDTAEAFHQAMVDSVKEPGPRMIVVKL